MTSLLRSVLSIFSGKVAGIIIGFVFTPILVRIISQPQYGVYASVFAAYSIVTLISKGGLFDATRKMVSEYIGDKDTISSIVSTSLCLSVFYALIVSSIAIIITWTGIIPDIYIPYVWILAGLVLFRNIFAIIRGTLYGLQHESIGEILKVSQRIVYSILALLLAYIGYDVFGVFVAYVLSFVVFTGFGLVLLFRYSSYSLPEVADLTSYTHELVSFGGYQLIGGISALLLYKSDILLVEFYEGTTSTALYQSAIIPAEMIWFVPSAIQLAFLQHTASLWSDDEIDKINENIKIGVKYSVLSLALFGVGLFSLAEPFLAIYFGPEYTDSSTVLQLLIIGTIFFGISRVIAPVFQATGLVKQTELITVCALVVNISLNLILIPMYGIIGAGIGTATSYVVMFVGNFLLWIHSPFDLVPKDWVIKLVLVQSLFAVCFFTFVSWSNFPPLISLIVSPPVGLLLFLGMNVMAGFIPAWKIRSAVSQIG
ncbi:flippase [Salinigranum marinum]|uniref:flippase n=1 Tax=Salinigranum marinum TaxID=1515595 RepID=UPI002989A001|nr:flippase [Salinigranum marinum]